MTTNFARPCCDRTILQYSSILPVFYHFTLTRAPHTAAVAAVTAKRSRTQFYRHRCSCCYLYIKYALATETAYIFDGSTKFTQTHTTQLEKGTVLIKSTLSCDKMLRLDKTIKRIWMAYPFYDQFIFITF